MTSINSYKGFEIQKALHTEDFVVIDTQSRWGVNLVGMVSENGGYAESSGLLDRQLGTDIEIEEPGMDVKDTATTFIDVLLEVVGTIDQ